MATRTPDRTRARLLEAAGELFAAQGFHGTTVREIAERAGVNLAASNYHFGSKRSLYLEVFREYFARAQAELRVRGGAPRLAELARLDPDELRAVLHARVRVMLELLIGPPPGLHGMLMQREMTDPSDAFPVIVKEFIQPMKDDLEAIVARLTPGLDRTAVEYATFSVVGQALFYRFAMPVVLRMLGRRSYTPELTAALAEHIAGFSLGGLEAVGRPAARRARAR